MIFVKLEDLRILATEVPSSTVPEQYALMQERLRNMGLDPDHLYQELEMSHRFVQAHRDISYSNGPQYLHSHSFYEILCCRTNCAVEYLVGSDRFRLQKGDIIVVPPGVSHRPLLPESMAEPYVRDVLWISMEFVDKLRQMFDELDIRHAIPQNLLRTAGTKWEHICDFLQAAVEESNQQAPGWDIVVTGNAIAFLANLQRALQSGDTSPIRAETPDLLEQVLAYIERNLGKRITLADTARYFYVSSSTISHLFQQKMGVSFYLFVTQRRLINAKKLIEERLPMEAVAEQSGFSDYSAFYRAFRKEYGINPRQYRAMQTDNAG